ncbi:MAG: hypothetical protein OXU20_26730, partial [Myxococcales bacterium]|nr:hypothetical protein [Myxococcales bacterium]MDD9971731.1 hypothetical protein [Myxococcales bacterium]
MKLMTDNSRDLATVLALVLALAGSAPMVAAAQEPEPEAPGQAEEADPPEGDLVTRYRPKDLRRLCRWRNLTPIYAVAGAVTQGTPGDDCIVGSPGNDTVQAGGGDDIVIGGGG